MGREVELVAVDEEAREVAPEGRGAVLEEPAEEEALEVVPTVETGVMEVPVEEPVEVPAALGANVPKRC